MKSEKKIPFAFVIDELERLHPVVRPMFGCFAIYVDVKMMVMLRKRDDHTDDNGVWLATEEEHHENLKKILPSMRPIKLLGNKTKWQMIPDEAEDFEESVMTICQLILKGDKRIGKVPKSKSPRKKIATAGKSTSSKKSSAPRKR